MKYVKYSENRKLKRRRDEVLTKEGNERRNRRNG